VDTTSLFAQYLNVYSVLKNKDEFMIGSPLLNAGTWHRIIYPGTNMGNGYGLDSLLSMDEKYDYEISIPKTCFMFLLQTLYDSHFIIN
jgi:hypothetical protein